MSVLSSIFQRIPRERVVRVVRAVAITALLSLWTIEALPTSGIGEEQLHGAPIGRALMGMDWALGRLGAPKVGARIEASIVSVSDRLTKVRRAILAPVLPFYRLAGMEQRWALFRAGGKTTCRLQIEGQKGDGAWQLLYRPQEADVFSLSPLLGYRRMRGIYDGCKEEGPAAHYDGFANFIAGKVLSEHAELAAVRVSLQRLRVGSKKEPRTVIAVYHERVRERS